MKVVFFSRPDRNSIFLFALICFVVYGFFLRIYALDNQSLWIDEAFTINAAQAILERGLPILESGFFYTSGILNSYVTAMSLYALRSFGVVFASRFPSVIFGILAIIITYQFGKKSFSKEVGLLAAIFVTFSVWEIAWSRQARMYQQFQFLYMLALYCFYNFIHNKNRKTFLFTAISTFLTILSHSLGFTLLLIFLFYILIMLFKKDNFSKDVYNLLIDKFISNTSNRKFLFVLTSTVALIALAIFSYYSLINYNFVKIDYLNDYLHYLKGVHFVFFYLSLGGLILSFRDFKRGLLISLAIVIPLLVISKLVYLLHYRYVYFFLPLLFVLAASFIDMVSKNVFKKYYLIFTVIVAVILMASTSFVFLPHAYYKLEKQTPQQNFKEVYEFLKRNVMEEDIIIDAYPAVNKIYLGKVDYALKFSLSGREVDIFNKTNDVYTGISYISLNELKDIKNCWIIADEFALSRLNSTLKSYIKLLELNALEGNNEEMTVYRCQ